MSEMNESKSQLTVDECKKNLRLTRDFDLYLDMLNILKSGYLIILCLKNTSGQNISEETAERIRSLGFSNFTAEPDMKYVGIVSKGDAAYDSSSEVHSKPLSFDVNYSKNIRLFISFDKANEAEIKINGEEQSLNDKGINIVVYDLRKSETVDACSYNASEGNPIFFHRNFYYDSRYIDTHVYIPESFKDSVALSLRRSYSSNRSLNVREVERGVFLRSKYVSEIDKYFESVETYKTYGGVCDENLKFISGHQLANPRNIVMDGRHIWDGYEVSPEEIEYIDETVLYGGTLMEHPGHLIAECFADRLWWIARNADSDIKIVIETTGKSGDIGFKGSFVVEFFDALGISEDRLIFLDKPTRFKKIIVPDQSAIPLFYCFPYEFTSGYIETFQHMRKSLAPGEHKKIYLTKSKLHRSSVIGEEYFINFFEKKGFAIINPEDYTLKEKAAMMYGADEVVTIDGTNSLFTVFCKPSVRLTILTRRMDFWDIPQQMINEALGIKEFFLVNTSGNFLDSFSGNAVVNFAGGMTFVYATKEFAKYVKYVYNEEIDITPEESLKKHFYEYLKHFPEYYSDPVLFGILRSIKMTDIMKGMSEVFLGKELDVSDMLFFTDDEIKVKKLELRLRDERKEAAEKIKQLSEKAKEFIDENVRLKNSLAQSEAEIERLREKNSELSSYMAEVSQLLDALEAQGGPPSEQ